MKRGDALIQTHGVELGAGLEELDHLWYVSRGYSSSLILQPYYCYIS